MGIFGGYRDCNIILMMFFMNPIEFWLMKSGMGDIEKKVFSEHKK